mmetsp:Transcript_5409/g.10313  ORF Transcript_5409/g.10313 Transcript_5409/m.10313 type:complete len:310 (+) Transcript_5409:354-1283(+)|eukprot:CAMPEP_0114241536 /NCGR_PEP_ID=MMETSP0058-20121206/9682_1 /TAXON_ID=36894 /ORGANISM="Pyramimonas parkeae, CCMP726" /LENGTH=309 /DNA_ID=CAMNT_0001354063 /DNA_START=288 /DNA_END=1217 /DNA_ORIENTATION=-
MSCALSSVFACLWCASGCSSRKVGAQFAFFPPEPPTYHLNVDDAGNAKVRLHVRVAGRSDLPTVRTHVELLTTSLGQRIPVFSFRVPKPTCCIVFSHGNAMDCGIIFHYWMEMAHTLSADVFAYDYTGYGASTGVPSERDTYADIEAVYHYIESLGVDPADNIILYGQSVGTGPSCHLAARKPVRGLVLHSPMVTGIRVISNDNSVCAPASIFRSCDLFTNVKQIPNIEAKVYIMHGTNDAVIDVSHAEYLLSKWPQDKQHPPYFVQGAGHDDIYETDPVEFYRRLREFIEATSPSQRATPPHFLPNAE